MRTPIRPPCRHASPNGRYLGFIDRGRLPGVAVVVDLEVGEEVVRSTTGMGSPHEDLEDLYEELEPDVFGITDSVSYVAATDEVYSYDLPSGDRELVAEDIEEIWDDAWFAELRNGDATQQPRQP